MEPDRSRREGHRRWPRRSAGQWVSVVLGLGVLVAALFAATEPYREVREFRAVAECGRSPTGCFDDAPASLVDQRTYTETSGSGETTSTTTYYEITWQAADGSRRTRDVSPDFYDEVRKGQSIRLRLWHEEVVGVRAGAAAQWFLPRAGRSLQTWLHLAHLGLGITLWGLLFGVWDGLGILVFRVVAWMFVGTAPAVLTTLVLAYGPGFDTGAGHDVGRALLLSGMGAAALVATRDFY